MKKNNGNSWWFSALILAVLMCGLIGAKVICNDVDFDLVQDDVDNCVENYNPNQQDEDGDSLGDPCDNQTPYHEYKFGPCYRTNYPPFTGAGWEDIKTIVAPNGPGRYDLTLIWPDKKREFPEIGPGQENGRDIWGMSQWIGVEYATGTRFEATMAEANNAGYVAHFDGSFVFLECENCEFNMDWTEFGRGNITGDIMPAEFCGLELDDDTTVPIDDDTADDDTTPDDDSANDDNTDDDDAADDDAADDDAADDDQVAGDDDNNDDSSACGC